MCGPLKFLVQIDLLPGPSVYLVFQAAQGQAVLYWANGYTKIAANAFLLIDFVASLSIIPGINSLMRRVLTNDMTTTTFNAQILINLRLDGVIKIEVLPVCQGRNRTPDGIADRGKTFLLHKSIHTIDHVIDDLESMGHRRGTDLHIARPHEQKLCRIAPIANTANG